MYCCCDRCDVLLCLFERGKVNGSVKADAGAVAVYFGRTLEKVFDLGHFVLSFALRAFVGRESSRLRTSYFSKVGGFLKDITHFIASDLSRIVSPLLPVGMQSRPANRERWPWSRLRRWSGAGLSYLTWHGSWLEAVGLGYEVSARCGVQRHFRRASASAPAGQAHGAAPPLTSRRNPQKRDIQGPKALHLVVAACCYLDTQYPLPLGRNR